ncbi:MBL fold metallo-hydrolase [Massilia sp. ST3]|uniref:MBL fold metallo-hydrolase n=1 Tax=Massilia sp. ST3 TaxID=2824903 RepID=UPI001B827560|nr:MBL fold metallo-hydrolase [Massilia sp. ST3]MBQ5946739.1 MBL fold metallo-hydrolase [Massilia sp. ST3]
MKLSFAALCLAGCGLMQDGWHSPVPALQHDPAAPAAPGITAQWFGVSTLHLGDGETTILIDGFLSRPHWLPAALLPLKTDEELVRTTLHAHGLRKVDALLVAHSHYDHALDAPFVASATGAVLVGSASTAAIAQGAGLGARRVCQVEGGDWIRVGKFDIRIIATPHIATLLDGEVASPFARRSRIYHYRLGDNFSFLVRHPLGSILVVPSAATKMGMFRDVRADIVFLSIAQLGKRSPAEIGEFWREAVRDRGAFLVIPVHWDNFTRPLDRPPRPFPWPIDRVDSALEELQPGRRHAGCRAQDDAGGPGRAPARALSEPGPAAGSRHTAQY